MLNKRIKAKEFANAFIEFEQAKQWFERSDFTSSNNCKVKTITFQVTETCNLQCTYCYQINKSSSSMTFETAKKFIDMIIEDSYKESSYVYVGTTPAIVIEFIGGEPLLETKLISDILDYFKYVTISKRHPWSKNYMASMISNGVLYFNEEVQELIKRNENKLDFAISLDGCKELHDSCRVFPNGDGSYDLAEKGCLHYMKNHNPNMSTKMTIAPENITWTLEAFKNLCKLGYKNIHANCIYEEGWNKKLGKEYYNQLKMVADYLLDNNLENEIYTSLFEENLFKPLDKEDDKNYCGTTGYMLALAPSGDIYTCIRFMNSSLGKDVKPFSIGHIESGIGRNPNHKNRINLLDSITRKSQSTDECFNCTVASGCGWCTALNYQINGTPNKRLIYICDMHKARSLANVYYWNKVYKNNNEDNIFEMNLSEDEALKYIDKNEYEMLVRLSK